MSIQFSLGKGLLRAAVSVGFLGCLIAEGTVSSQAATSESAVVASKSVMGVSVATPGFCANRCDLILTLQIEIGLPDEFGVVFEDGDSIGMLRVGIEQRTFGIDRDVIGPGVASKTARNICPSISPPLLV